MSIQRTWRDDPGLIFESEYKKKFAWLPVICSDGQKIWWKTYYQFFTNWGHSYSSVQSKNGLYQAMFHQDFIGNITEEDYLVRKLSDTL